MLPERYSAQPGQVSVRNMSSKSWSASTSTSTPWLGLVSILVRRLARAGTRTGSSALARTVCRLARAGRLCMMSHIFFTSLGTNRLRE